MKAAPSNIQMSATTMASQTSARTDRVSQSGRVAEPRRVLVRDAARSFRARSVAAEAAPLDGDVVKVEATQLRRARKAMSVEKLQATNHLSRAGRVHPVRAAKSRDCAQREDIAKRESPSVGCVHRTPGDAQLLIQDERSRMTPKHLCCHGQCVQRFFELKSVHRAPPVCGVTLRACFVMKPPLLAPSTLS